MTRQMTLAHVARGRDGIVHALVPRVYEIAVLLPGVTECGAVVAFPVLDPESPVTCIACLSRGGQR